MSGVKTRLLRRINGVTRKAKIRNQYLRNSIIVDRKQNLNELRRLRWLGYIFSGEITGVVSVVKEIYVSKRRKMNAVNKMAGCVRE